MLHTKTAHCVYTVLYLCTLAERGEAEANATSEGIARTSIRSSAKL